MPLDSPSIWLNVTSSEVLPMAVAPRRCGATPPHCVAPSATALAAAGMPTTTQVTWW